MKIRKVSPEEAAALTGEVKFSPDVKKRLRAYKKWLEYIRHEKMKDAHNRVIEKEVSDVG